MNWRNTLKARAPRLADWYRGVRYREVSPPFRRRFALGELHDRIKESFGAVRNGFFVEAGALDGLYQSNTAYLERYLGWSGILVEPLPHKFAECARNRPKSKAVHAALVGFDYEGDSVTLDDDDAMSVTRGISEQTVALPQTSYEAPARTLDAVLAEENYPRVDLFSLDVEGAEFEVLRGIDFARADIRNIVVETADLPRVTELLAPQGFVMQRQLTFHDYHFARTLR